MIKINITKILLLVISSTTIFGQHHYEDVSTNYESGQNHVSHIDRINVYTGERETIIDLLDLGYFSWFPRLDITGTKVFTDKYLGNGYVMIDIANPTQQIDLSRDLTHPEEEGYCYSYHAQTNKLYFAWTKLDLTMPLTTGQLRKYAAVIDPNTGATIKQIEPFFDICGSVFRADGQRIYGVKDWTPEEYDAGIVEDHAMIIDTENDELIESIPFENLVIGSDRVYTLHGTSNLVLISYIIDNNKYLCVRNMDTGEISKSIKVEGYGNAYISPDGKYVIDIENKQEPNYNYLGHVRVFPVIWPVDNQIIQYNEGNFLKLPEAADSQHPITIIDDAPEVFMYKPDVDSPKYLVRTKDAKLIRINHRPITQTFSVFATNSIWLKDSVNVKSGYVGVNDLSSGPFLNANVQLSIDNYAKTAKIEEIFANSIKVKNNAVVRGNVYTNALENNGKVKGTINNPFTFPVITDFPVFQSATPNTFSVTVQEYENITLDPGNYDDLLVKKGGKVVFTGGIYNFNAITMLNNTKLRFANPSEVRVADKLSTKPKVIIAPKTNSDITASDIVFYIAGINGANGGLNENPKAAKIGKNSEVKANLYVPNGTLYIKADSKTKGAFWAKDVIIGERTVVNIKSAWELEF